VKTPKTTPTETVHAPWWPEDRHLDTVRAIIPASDAFPTVTGTAQRLNIANAICPALAQRDNVVFGQWTKRAAPEATVMKERTQCQPFSFGMCASSRKKTVASRPYMGANTSRIVASPPLVTRPVGIRVSLSPLSMACDPYLPARMVVSAPPGCCKTRMSFSPSSHRVPRCRSSETIIGVPILAMLDIPRSGMLTPLIGMKHIRRTFNSANVLTALLSTCTSGVVAAISAVTSVSAQGGCIFAKHAKRLDVAALRAALLSRKEGKLVDFGYGHGSTSNALWSRGAVLLQAGGALLCLCLPILPQEAL
jgi:hypothetical protein